MNLHGLGPRGGKIHCQSFSAARGATKLPTGSHWCKYVVERVSFEQLTDELPDTANDDQMYTDENDDAADNWSLGGNRAAPNGKSTKSKDLEAVFL